MTEANIKLVTLENVLTVDMRCAGIARAVLEWSFRYTLSRRCDEKLFAWPKSLLTLTMEEDLG